MAQTNVQAFSGDVELNDRLTINSSVGNIVKKSFTNYNTNGSTKYWKVATGNYSGYNNQVKMNVNTHRVDRPNLTRRLVMQATAGDLTFNPCIDEHEIGSYPYDLRVYKNTSTTTFDIYLQIGSYSYVDVEILFSGTNITVFDTPTWETSAPTTSATYILEFTNGNLNAMRITNDGNVGIGKTNPGSALDVVGDVAISSNLAVDTNTLFVDSVGNKVGIGTTNPSTLLDLKKDSTNGASIQFESSDGYKTSIGQKSYSTADRAFQFTSYGSSAGDNPVYNFLALNSDENAYNSILTMTGNGNVGIGTATPGAKLDVNGSTRSGYNTNTTSYFGRSAIGYVGHSDWAGFAHIDGNNTTDYALLQSSEGITYLNCKSDQFINFTSGNIEKMRMLANGNFGIGTVNPSYKLDVNGTVRFTSPWHSSSSITKARYTTSTYFNCIPTNTVTGYISYKVQIRFDPSPGDPPYAAAALVDWFPIGTNTANTNLNIDVYLLTTAHASNGINHSMYVSGTDGLGVGTSGLRCRTASDYYAGTFVTRWYQIGTND